MPAWYIHTYIHSILFIRILIRYRTNCCVFLLIFFLTRPHQVTIIKDAWLSLGMVFPYLIWREKYVPLCCLATMKDFCILELIFLYQIQRRNFLNYELFYPVLFKLWCKVLVCWLYDGHNLHAALMQILSYPVSTIIYMFPQLHFTYEKEPHSEEFFIAYIRQLFVSNRYGST